MRSIDTDSVAPAVPKPPVPRLPPRLPIHKAALLGLSCLGDPTRLPYLLLPKIANRYGDIVRLFTGPTPALTLTLINHPDYVDHVFTRHHDRYVKHEATIELVSGEPVALPLLEGREWKRVRSAFNPYFGERALAQATPLMMEGITERVDAWSRHVHSGELVDLEHELGAVVMDGLMRSMFKVRLRPAEIDHAVDGARRYGVYVISRVAMHFLPRWLPNPLRRSGEEAKAELFGILDRFVQERAGCPSTGTPDLVDTLLALEFDGCPQIRERRRRSEAAGLVFAGFETTAAALAWTIALLCRNPIALGKAYAEVDALGGKTLAYDDLENLKYLRACFDEAQRFQAAPANVRTAIEDDEVGGYFIPRGSQVIITQYALQRDPRFWNEPERFNPDRFLTDKINRNTFLPFSIGPRKCMGTRMAYIEGTLVLGAILQRYAFQIRDGWTPMHRVRVSTGLAGGLPARLFAR
ncbi:cytochrome P450 [Mycobacteroides abscessus]|uniref:Cytochrome P450 n=1 Tax=Mycobacteroides abscessus subsp. abscessus TaxID=1185650 RepID=A0AB38D3W9_9MYCO|nr:cytochrome P450 [Mycobacteroides abscessus]AKP58048.1 cytochrome P450 [Mycobacteroides abscessus UC22]AMU55535.1 cytochrome P450 [Mycobacteroides abscessus]EIT99271.1 putative cytochrome P450 [Mycobacteroides abscessus 4S-0726-RB]EIU01282.1 putative cytochrome P450 [Mycobacteroides abscessus 4S-0726-RA]EIU03525.1 putative cytochrome P450 [Mycobacteroides abscessus 4S-0303]